MAWNRKARLFIGRQVHSDKGKAVLNQTALDVSELHFEFEVTQSIAFEDGEAQITVFNLSETSRNSVLVGQSVIIECGYEDTGKGAIFVGEIREVVHSHSSTDWITKIKAQSGRPVLSRLSNTAITLSYASGTALSQVAKEIGAGLGITVQGAENARAVLLKNGMYCAGRYASVIARLKAELEANKLSLYIDFNQMVIYKQGQPAEYTVVDLDDTSGLLTAKPVRTASEMAWAMNGQKRKLPVQPSDLRDRISFTTVLLPQIRPNGIIRINGASVKGLYLVEKLKYKGDSYGKTWVIEGEGSRRASK